MDCACAIPVECCSCASVGTVERSDTLGTSPDASSRAGPRPAASGGLGARLAAGEIGPHPLGRLGGAEQIALHLGAAFQAHMVELLDRLDPLGGGRDAEALAEP